MNSNIDFDRDPLGGGQNLSIGLKFFYAYLREELMDRLDYGHRIITNKPYPIPTENPIDLYPVMLLSSYALENLFKGCVWEILLLSNRETDPKIKKDANKHNIKEMIRFIEDEWSITLSPELWRYTDTLKEKILWRAKYPHSLQGISGYEIIFEWSPAVKKNIQDLWNFFWTNIDEKSPQIHLHFFRNKPTDQLPYDYFEKIMRKNFTEITGCILG